MPTIADILRQKRLLIRESAALIRLGMRNNEPSRQWLRTRLPHELAMLPRQAHLYRLADIDRLRAELETLAKLAPPR